MPMRPHFHCKAALLALAIASLAGCASTPAEPVPFKEVPQARIVQPGYTHLVIQKSAELMGRG
ncbi:hypothetical protein R69658_06082 [Paraburkholderia aspalathi]|uniref:Uncharacterized protein n=1 Tax=Paraburkholderia aspalathi TaxID=1324617 RepID=A0ABN7MTL5_9BURK|nr:hypothetical protein [Paraburkholderia aspalathi]MBK3822388.1 hypothetical protein [Paraburkholderia aspalathi]MBK3834221.1 hypothetical protein [Paraburkholderia aspalathi]MBK3863945.1 hypothetical protein [Paraburkholderia aspalathi]CAE6826252.1 hypothetical protein R69658_06082 [Paraburkholderia aspalathi]